MRRYESYKDSGVEWLGEVPSHWEVENSKRVFSYRKDKAEKTDEQLTSSQKYGVIPQDLFMDLEGRRVTVVEFNYEILKHVEKGDFVISMRSFQGGIEYCNYTGCVSSAYVALIPTSKVHSQYYRFLLKSVRYIEALQSTSNLVRDGQALRYENFCMVPLIVPPFSEQQKIAQFLDDKTAKIDQAVDLAEKQIALLKEHKQILIQNAVTRGLNPDVPLKDSGVEWIGQVPEHWDVKKLKFVSKINQHTLPENTNGSLSIKYVDIGSVSFENGIEKVENFSFKNAPSRARRLANKGDIVVSTVRTYLKAITMVKEEYQDCIFSTGFAVVTSNECLKDSFFELYAKSDAFTEQVSVFSKGMSYPAINSTDLSNLWITVPPLSEQQKIADYLDTQTAKIDQAIALKTDHIEKLKEYKSVLINNVVTGKVQV